MSTILKRKTGRNDECPCGSKKKYKHCHGGTFTAPKQKTGQIDARMKQLAPKSVCLAPDSMLPYCNGRIISSHTVSRSGSLGAIARDGHVYSHAFSVQHIEKMSGKVVPRLTGWREASTFPGFCAYHDKHLFAPLEDEDFVGSQQQCFLLAYRSIAWELYAKKNAVNQSLFRNALVISQDSMTRSIMQDFNYGNELGLRDAEANKAKYDAIFSSESWSDCHGILVEFDHLFPIQCSAAWAPTEDIHGETIQKIDYSLRTPQTAAIASISAHGNSYFLLCWLEESQPVVSKLAASIEALPKTQIAGVLAALLLLTSENCHYAPEWYDALPHSGRNWVHNLAHPFGAQQTTPVKAGRSNYLGCIGINSIRRF